MAIIMDSETFQLHSNGNGLFYTLYRKNEGKIVEDGSLFFQGDDAIIFEDNLNALEIANPEETVTFILAELWYIYSS